MNTAAGTSTVTLLALCMLALGAPALGAPGPEAPFDRGPPRCQPEPPSEGVYAHSFVSTPLPRTEVQAMVVKTHQGLWAVGDGGFIALRPPGQVRWERQQSGTRKNLRTASVQQGQTVWAGGEDHTLLRWSNGSWETMDLPGRGDITALDFERGNVGVVGDDSGHWRFTRDYGQTWTSLPTLGSSPATVVYGGAEPVLGRADGSVLVTKFVNDKHEVVSSSVVSEGKAITGLLVLNQSILIATDADGRMFQTLDRGEHWKSLKSPVGEVVAIVDSPLGHLVVGRGGELATVGAGKDKVEFWKTYTAQQRNSFEGKGSEIPVAPENTTVLSSVAGAEGIYLLTDDEQLLFMQIEHWFSGGHPCGRPLEVDGASRVAAPATGPGWAVDLPAAESLSPEAAGALAAAWLVDARAEHASVASFARFVLRLMALGAPVELVRDAQEAMADELRHAEQCFGLASRYAGELLAPGPLRLDGALDGPSDLASVAVEVLREGAIGETLGAALAAAMLEGAVDADVRRVLRGVARDEASHAQAGWRFLAWAVEQGGDEVRAALREALPAALDEHLATSARVVTPHVAGWQEHGRLSANDQRTVVSRTLAAVVGPCMERLLGGRAV